MPNTFWKTIKSYIFPLKQEETLKILSICLLKGFISSIFSILSNLKGAIIIEAQGSGAEVIPVLKGFVVLPISILFIIIYSKLSNIFTSNKIFYSIMFFFIGCFFLYAFILRPNENLFTPTESYIYLLKILGSHNSHWIAIYKNWIHSFFYLISDLWSQAVIFILFWEFVNRVCDIDQAKRSYNLFIASGSLSNLITAFFTYNFVKKSKLTFDYKVQVLLGYVIIAIIILLISYYFLSKNTHIQKKQKIKTKLGFFEGLKFILKSKYLISIAITVISVGLTVNLIEVTWNANLKLSYPNKEQFVTFMAKVNGLQNLFALFIVFFISGNLLRKIGWKFSAQITPLIILFTGTLFFLASRFKLQLFGIAHFFNLTSLKLVVFFGAFQVISSKISKYCFYDLTKEIAYIPLDNESKTKGKAAIDAVGSRLGKSGSSYIHLFILWIIGTNSVLQVTSLLIPVLIFICICWLFATSYIASHLKKK